MQEERRELAAMLPDVALDAGRNPLPRSMDLLFVFMEITPCDFSIRILANCQSIF